MKYTKRHRYSDFAPPKKIVYWFLSRFVMDADAFEFACRLWHIIPPEDLSISQQKKINYNLKRKYNWLNFDIYKIDTDRWEISPCTQEASWARGYLFKDEYGDFTFTTRPRRALPR